MICCVCVCIYGTRGIISVLVHSVVIVLECATNILSVADVTYNTIYNILGETFFDVIYVAIMFSTFFLGINLR